jgi:thioredoxin-related protein
MVKKKKIINILLAAILLITLNFLFILNGCSNSNSTDTVVEEETNSLKNIYQRFIESGKPSILVFSYDADCCATTKAFFDNYNGMAKKILEDYKSKFNTLFINIGILDKNNMNTAIDIATQNEVLNLPSILLLDKTGKVYKVIEGPFNDDEVRKVLDGMLND